MVGERGTGAGAEAMENGGGEGDDDLEETLTG